MVAEFSDSNPSAPAGDFTAAINWGDGTAANPDITSGVVSAIGGRHFSVAGSHAFLTPGAFPIAVNVLDTLGGSTTVNGTANVSAATCTVNTAPTLMP